MRFRTYSVFTAVAVAVALIASMTIASAGPPGFRTKQPSMLTPVMADVEILPILTVGDDLAGGYQFEAIPDGISVRPKLNGRAEILVNHETSKVPFPYNPSVAVTDPAESQNDFDNAQVSRLTLNAGGRVMRASFAIDSAEGFQRFCSNFLATITEGFDRDILFTNEESPDYVLRQEASWPVAIDDPNEKEAGLVVAYDVDADTHRTIPGMGRHNHENAVAIPGYDDLVVLSGDDTFTSGPLTDPTAPPPTPPAPPTTLVAAQSELYSYIAPDTDSLLDDEGQLWAFVSDDAAVDDYYDFTPTNSSTLSVSGHFIPVPRNIATGLNPDGSEMTSADVPAAQGGPYPPPPADGTWQRDLRSSTPIGIDGPQWVLQYWATQNNVFEFVRVEDIAYDKRPGMENVVYVVDSGRGSAGASQAGRSTNGRVWKMVLDTQDPTQVDSLSVLVEGDDNEVKTLSEIHQPDNLETTANGLLVTEDPGSSQQFAATDTSANATTARLWWVPFSGSPEVVAKVNQSADEGPTDVDPPDNPPLASAAFLVSPGNLGAWESSGIVDASKAFGPGAFLIDVQAHTLWVEKAPGIDTPFDGTDTTNPDFTFKREGGQLLLIRIPATVAE
jgi:hypothetical protein